jgi:formylglycine-generating enzyme required for sulfatase activity
LQSSTNSVGRVSIKQEGLSAVSTTNPTSPAAAAPVSLFISYAHRDEEFRLELNDHLSNLKRQGLIAGWHDRLIVPGQEWAKEIDDALNQARVILLLISARFMASDYCHDKEMLRALERHNAAEAVVIPIILSECDWQGAPFSKLQALPKDAKPIKSWPDRDAAWTDVVRGLRRVIEAQPNAAAVVNAPAVPPVNPVTPAVPAAGQGNVAIGGSVNGGIIITGSGNTVISGGAPAGTGLPVPPAPVPSPRGELDFGSKQRLVEALLRCACLQTVEERNQVVNALPNGMGNHIKRHAAAKPDVLSIVTTCLNFSAGLKSLLEIVESFDGGSLQWEQVQTVLREVLPDWQAAEFFDSKIPKELGRASQNTLELTTFSFEIVTLDERGKVKERRQLTARQFREELAPEIVLEMVEIPGGKFEMGAPKAEKDSSDDERPQHEVEVAPFFMGKFTVTQAQWRVVAGWEKVKRELDPRPSRFPDKKRRTAADDQRPVEQVSWAEAQEFCARLSVKTKRQYRLPSEAEWEYACRAGTTTPFAFGPTITPEFVNYDGNWPYGEAPNGQSREETVPVGSLGVANAFGLYDMHGNVWEWCEDLWHDTYTKAPTDGSAWLSGGDSSLRVLRGGSWIYYANGCRSACRHNFLPAFDYFNFGFRVVVSARMG